MKKFVNKSVSFAVFFAVFFLLINVLFLGIIVTTDFDVRNRIESLRFKDPNYDILILGASTSSDGIDTELLSDKGIESYNLALGGTNVKANIIQLSEYLTRYSFKPKYVLLGINSQLLQTFDDDLIHPIIEVTMKDHDFGLEDVPILKFKWLGFEFLKKVVSKKVRKAKLSYGQLKFQKTSPDNTNYKELYLDLHEIESSYQIGELAKLCNQYEIELIVIEMPGYRVTQNLSETGPYSIFFNNGYAADLYNCASRDFCTIFEANEDWIGNSHLNEYGAFKFTNELYRLIWDESE